MKSYIAATLVCVLISLVACGKKTPEEETGTVQRTDYTKEEFGIGRRHTPDRKCNKEIDYLLNKIRLCYQNNGISNTCDNVQKKSNNRIGKLKNSVRCAR